MGNTMRAHLFKRRQHGEREEVILKLFYPDGTPCDLDSMEGGGGGSSAGQLHYAGEWDADTNYTAGALVTWFNPALNSLGLYLTTEDVVGGDDPTLWIRLSDSVDITGMMRWQGIWGEFDGLHQYGHTVRHNGALWFALGDVVGEPGVDSTWDAILPASMFGGGGTTTAWANLTLKNNLNWLTQDIAQWRRNGDHVELRGSFRKLFGNGSGTGMNDFADALPEEHWPSRNTTAGTILSDSAGNHPVLLQYDTNGRLEVGPDASYTDPVVHLDGVFFDLS